MHSLLFSSSVNGVNVMAAGIGSCFGSGIKPTTIDQCIRDGKARVLMFLKDGEVPLDNNATEGALRSFCLHKHT